MVEDELVTLSATALIERYRDRSVSPVEVTEAVLARIALLDGAVNAFVLVDKARAHADACAAEARWAKGEPAGLVDGVPVTIKDLVLVEGWPMRSGSLTSSPAPVATDAPATARLREHGAVFLGKTTTPEFGWKGVTDSPLTGVTRNPWNTSLTPGGSSGGAAVAAALGMGALHLGGDAGGSIRIPGAFTGIFGLKPSFGRVPRYPPGAHGTLSHAGPMTRTVADAALMLTVISEPDSQDWFSLPYDKTDYRDGLEDGVGGLRIAYSPALGYGAVDPEIAALVEDGAKLLASLGALVTQTDPGFEDPIGMFMQYWYGSSAFATRAFSEAERAQLDPGLREVVEQGDALSLFDYLTAAEARIELGVHMNGFFEDYDLLITPTLPIPAFEAGRDFPPGWDMASQTYWSPFTYPFNLTQHPAATVPCGFTKAGLPAGLQIVGGRHNDRTVLRAARAFERERPFEMPQAPNVTHDAAC
ncbi:MAG: amidase [Alphaproteobacteria bacterium]|nr:amidase [Alphaproteobacteria bacterium]